MSVMNQSPVPVAADTRFFWFSPIPQKVRTNATGSDGSADDPARLAVTA